MLLRPCEALPRPFSHASPVATTVSAAGGAPNNSFSWVLLTAGGSAASGIAALAPEVALGGVEAVAVVQGDACDQLGAAQAAVRVAAGAVGAAAIGAMLGGPGGQGLGTRGVTAAGAGPAAGAPDQRRLAEPAWRVTGHARRLQAATLARQQVQDQVGAALDGDGTVEQQRARASWAGPDPWNPHSACRPGG